MEGIGRRVNPIVSGIIILLYLCSMTVLLLRSAYVIREQMLEEIQQTANQVAEKMTDVAAELEDESTRAEQLWSLQQVMADNETGLGTTYPFRCVSVLKNYDGSHVPVRSRNMLFVTVTWRDGTREDIPMTFEHENSADVAQLLLDGGRGIQHAAGTGFVRFTGYWQEGLFYIQRMETADMVCDYESPAKPPEGAGLEEIYVCCAPQAGNYGDRIYPVSAGDCAVTASMKCYGDNGSHSAFASQWEKADELMAVAAAQEGRVGSRGEPEATVLRRSLFSTEILVQMRLNRQTCLYSSGERLIYSFAAEFSPMGLAAEELLGSGMFWGQLALFALAGIFLNMTYSDARRRELRNYRDEITRQKQALEYAKNAEQSRREMTSAIAHELKTPIAVLSSYAEALQENIDAEKQSHYLSVIREETDRMDHMVLELLDLSRLEAGRYKLQREDFDLKDLAREIMEPLMPRIQEKELKLDWQVGVTTVNADRRRMGQVVENFMTNAIRHTPQGGKIVLRIGLEQETFSVENQGSQIPMEQLTKVWETFWQGDSSRSEKGSGLGLAICRTIADLHGGSCKAENTTVGVRFSIRLSGEKRRYQPAGRMPQERVVELEFSIAQRYTTVEHVLGRLELLKSRALERALRDGQIRLGGNVVQNRRTRLYPGYVLLWKEYRITVRLDDEDKRRMLLMERMRTGGLGNPDMAKNRDFFPSR